MRTEDIEKSLEREVLRYKGKTEISEMYISLNFLSSMVGLSVGHLYECSTVVINRENMFRAGKGEDAGFDCRMQIIDQSDDRRNVVLCNADLAIGLLSFSVLQLSPAVAMIIEMIEAIEEEWGQEEAVVS